MEYMRFEEFKNAVAEGIKSWLPASFEKAEVNINVVTKNNDLKLTGLTIKKTDSNIAPTIYLEEFYDKYRDGATMDEILDKIAEIRLASEFRGDLDITEFMDFEKCKDSIYPRLVCFESNQELLANRPHVCIEDLAVIFAINLSECSEGSMSIPVHNQLAAMWNVDENKLFEIAVENLVSSKTVTFRGMSEVIREMLCKEHGVETSEIELFLEMMEPEDERMYVLSNNSKLHGATMLLNKPVMDEIADKVGNGFYILPSSIHETIIVPNMVGMNVEDLRMMVGEVNTNEVAPEEILSDNVYTYSKEYGLKIA